MINRLNMSTDDGDEIVMERMGDGTLRVHINSDEGNCSAVRLLPDEVAMLGHFCDRMRQ